MSKNELTRNIIGAAIEVHKTLGPGLLESVYKECLYHKLMKQGFKVEKEKGIPVFFEEIKLDCGYRIDLLVEDAVIVELKSVDSLHNVHMAQTLTYMKLGAYQIGLLINFNVFRLKDGIKRLINDQ